MRKHIWKRLTALLLIVSMLTMDLGNPLFAVTDDTGLSEDTAYDDVVSDSTSDEAGIAADSEENTPVTTQEALILSEVEEEREESTKTFMLNDGTFMLAQYAVPVHYEDSEGN